MCCSLFTIYKLMARSWPPLAARHPRGWVCGVQRPGPTTIASVWGGGLVARAGAVYGVLPLTGRHHTDTRHSSLRAARKSEEAREGRYP